MKNYRVLSKLLCFTEAMGSPVDMPLDEWTNIKNCQSQRALNRHRLCVVISGEDSWVTSKAKDLLQTMICQGIDKDSWLWLGSSLQNPASKYQHESITQYLGRELQIAVVDIRVSISPDLLGAVSGTLCAGGLLILLISSSQNPDVLVNSCFWQRFNQVLMHSESCIHLQQSGTIRYPVKVEVGKSKAAQEVIPQGLADQYSLTVDQSQAVTAILRVVHGHRRRPLVIESHRGRGKTAALGIAAATLLKKPPQTGHGFRIIITAPLRSAVNAAFERVKCLFPEARMIKNRVQTSAALFEFIPPDQLLSELPEAGLLLVDEAAAIPEPMLQSFLNSYSRVVFSTTVHGYEGSGRGFAIRFRDYLSRHTPQWTHLEMTTPVRWGANDPVEALLFDLLLMDAQLAETKMLNKKNRTNTHFNWVTRNELVSSEVLLRQVFGLLVTAHYQTRPEDLRILLDEPMLHIGVMTYHENVVGVMLVMEEGKERAVDDIGEESEMLSHLVAQGRRRLKGNLVPQSLAAQSGLPEAMSLRYLRVMRIAVHPELQRSRQGTLMMQKLNQKAEELKVDMLATSFGATPELIEFWCHVGLKPVRLGMHRDAASGERAVLMLKPLSESGCELFKKAEFQFVMPFLFGLSELFPDITPLLIISLLKSLRSESHFDKIQLTNQEKKDLNDYIFHQKNYATVVYPLWKYVSASLFQQKSDLTERQNQILISKILQRKSWEEVGQLVQLSGKRAVECELKAGLSCLML